MARQFIHHEKTQGQLMCLCSETLEEKISEGNDVRIFDKIIDAINISCILEKYSSEGGKAYWPRILLKVLIYGYHKGIQSSRKLAFACIDSLSMKYLIGNFEISHETIASFRVRFREELPSIFKSVVQLIYKITGISIRLPFMDSVKLKASAADRHSKKKKDWIKKQDSLMKDVEKHIEEYLSNSIRIDKEEDKLFGSKNSGFEISSTKQELILLKVKEILEKKQKENQKKKIQKAQEKTDELKRELDLSDTKQTNVFCDDKNPSLFNTSQTPTLDEESDNQNSSEIENFSDKEILEIENIIQSSAESNENNTTEISNEEKYKHILNFVQIEDLLKANQHAGAEVYLNLTDHDARFVKINGQIRMGYNNQFTTNGQIPSSARATQQANDQNQFIPNINAAQQNLPDQKIEGGVADAGYFNGKTLKESELFGWDVYIAPGKKTEKNFLQDSFNSLNFIYNENEDHIICPENNILEFYSETITNCKKNTIYKSSPNVCMRCSAHPQCFKTKEDKKRGYRTVIRDEYTDYRKDMIIKMQTDEAKDIYKDRQIEPEPIFGNLKHNKGIRGFMVRGLSKVNGELQIMASCLCIGKLTSWLKKEENRERFNTILMGYS